MRRFYGAVCFFLVFSSRVRDLGIAAHAEERFRSESSRLECGTCRSIFELFCVGNKNNLSDSRMKELFLNACSHYQQPWCPDISRYIDNILGLVKDSAEDNFERVCRASFDCYGLPTSP